VTEYRLYCVNDAGAFTRAHEIMATSDEQALQIARDMKLPVKCELWERARKVAVLEPGAASYAATG
jgi:hypothetical protein